jgi:hypothetical protein
LGLCGEHVARLDGAAIHVNGASTTLGGVATHVGASQFEVLAQSVDEQCVGGGVNGDGFSVDFHLDLHA